MKKLLLIALLFIASPFAHAATNLVKNGSFEATAQSAGTWGVYNHIAGWYSLTGAGIEVRNNVAGSAYDGSNFVELDSDGSHSNSSMSQFIDTTKNANYILSFFYSPREGVAADSNGIEVFWNTQSLGVVTASGVGNSGNVWTEYTYTVTAPYTWSVLSFKAVGIQDGLGGSLDKVSLVAAPVPEPEMYGLMAVGLGVLGFVARRRKLNA